MTYRYDDVFFRYIEAGSVRSAHVVVPLLLALGATSVVDVGCGRGAWLRVWREAGVQDVVGVDGDYVERGSLAIPEQAFVPRDLTAPFDLGRRFDVATCLEVGEHIPTSAAATLVASLCRHSAVVAFSAAVPGQGGEHHVNEQPLDFWRGLFSAHGYRPFDVVRPQVAGNAAVESWYRYNLIVYANAEGQRRLAPSAVATRVPDGTLIPDVSPPLYRLRKQVLRRLSVDQVTRLAVAKHRLVLARMRLFGRAALPGA